jgi:pyrimidine-specific ribonucleoside hydrolase
MPPAARRRKEDPVKYPTRIIIDTDSGIDDVVALALAARSPELQILAVTGTYGNAPLDLVVRNARRVLELAREAALSIPRDGARNSWTFRRRVRRG